MVSEDLRTHFLDLEGLLDRIERSSNHYQVLALDRLADQDKITIAHRQAMSVLSPPDLRHAILPEPLVERIDRAVQRVSDAYLTLSNYGSRVEYDNCLHRKARIAVPIDLSNLETRRPDSNFPSSQNSPATSSSDETVPDSEAEHKPESRMAARQGNAQSSTTEIDAELISIKHAVGGQIVYTKPVTESEGGNRRRYQRLSLSIPAYVTGYDRKKGKWTEVAHTVDVSVGGLALEISEALREGAVLHLILPMPVKLRRHGHSEPTYQVYAIVRRVEVIGDDRRVVGLEFLGSSPPPGYLEKPWAKFRTLW